MYGSSSWGSYGSSSSLSSSLSIPSRPMDIAPRSNHTASCAFPSWPRRSSLDSDSSSSSRPTAFLSDEDLMGDPFDDSDAGSITSNSSSVAASPAQQPTADDIFQMQRQRAAMEYALVKQVAAEKERRRQAKKAQQAAAGQSSRRSSPKKSTHRTKLSNMTPIAE